MSSIDGQLLSARHLEELHQSAISAEQITARGYQTVTNPRMLPPAFTGEQRKLSGLLIPITNTSGDTVAWQLKPDSPRTIEGKQAKYEHAGRVCLDVPAAARPFLLDAEADLWITEGCKKVDSAVSHGIPCTVGVQGVWLWRQDRVTLPDWSDIRLKGRVCIIAFDSDVMVKASVRRAFDELSEFLAYRGAIVRYCLMPDLPGGAKCGLDDAFAAGLTRADLESMIVDILPNSGPEWEEPIPLDDPAGPPFPVDALPDRVRAFVEAVAAAAQVPADLAPVVALGTLSAAAGGKYELHISESSWREPIHLMLVAVAEPGTRKSAVFDIVSRPLADYERLVQEGELRAFAAWDSRRRILDRDLASCESDLSKHRGGGDSLSDTEARHLAAVNAVEDHRERKPRVTHVMADDITVEAAKSMLFEQAGALAIMSAESAFLSVAAGRYSDGSPNLDVILNGHAGDRIRVDRKGRPPETIARACLTLCLMVQPDVIRDLGKLRGFINRGGAARLLPAFPRDWLGTRSIDVEPVPEALCDGWALMVTLIARRRPSLTHGSYDPWSIRLGDGAATRFRDHRAWHEPGLQRGGRYVDIRDWAAKQPGAVLRTAGLLHVAEHARPETVPVPVETIDRAIVIADYFEAHARILYRTLGSRSQHAAAREVLSALVDLGSPTTRRELHQKMRDQIAFAQSSDLAEPLDLLGELGYLRRERLIGERGGRPSEVITLNPRYKPKTPKTPKTPHRDAGSPGSEGYEGIELSPETANDSEEDALRIWSCATCDVPRSTGPEPCPACGATDGRWITPAGSGTGREDAA